MVLRKWNAVTSLVVRALFFSKKQQGIILDFLPSLRDCLGQRSCSIQLSLVAAGKAFHLLQGPGCREQTSPEKTHRQWLPFGCQGKQRHWQYFFPSSHLGCSCLVMLTCAHGQRFLTQMLDIGGQNIQKAQPEPWSSDTIQVYQSGLKRQHLTHADGKA